MTPSPQPPGGALLGQRKLVLTLAVLLSLLGLVSWLTMVRQEDPRMPDYWGMVTVLFPGADAETVERLVLEPIEEELAHVEEIGQARGTANAEIAFVDLELRDHLDDTDAAWDRVRQALDEARADLPAGVSEPRLDDRQQDQESIVYALTGDADPLLLADAAEALKHRLLMVSGVTDVTLLADPGEQVTLELDDAGARRLGLSPAALVAQLAERSRILPGGSVAVDGREVRLRPQSEFASLAELRATPVILPSGGTVPLQAVARVRRGPEEPARHRMRSDGQPAVGLGVVAERGLNVVDWGSRVRAATQDALPELRRAFGPRLEVRELIYQPARVEARLANLNRSLLTGALVVAGVLVLAMGLRLGLVVASIVPLVSLSAMAVFALGGGVLHQMSIAAVVIALGMLVDNAIVVAEAIQWRLDRGEDRRTAAVAAVRELAVPLAGATATTLAAFVPMLLAEGMTARFTRAIPVVIMITLTVSYVYAVFVTPSLGAWALRPRRHPEGGDRLERLAGRVSDLAVRRPGRVLAAALLLVALSFAAFPLVRQEFFPSSDRNQLVVDLELPEGSHLDATDDASRRLERRALGDPRVTAVTSYLGRSAPHFYYNLSTIPWSPHFAQIVLETRGLADLEPLMADLRSFAARELPGAEVVVRKLEQGPQVLAPIEVRVFGEDLGSLYAGAERVMALLRDLPGTADVRHDLSNGSPMLRFHVDDAAAGRRGLSRQDVAAALYGATRGLEVGQYRGGDDPVPVVVRAAAGERLPLDRLSSLDVAGGAAGTGRAAAGEPVPLAQVARLEAEWRPGAIRHHDRRRTATVLSQLAPGATYSEVTEALVPRLATLELPLGVSVELGGAAESSGDANSAMARTLPAGLLLLVGILMAEFRSFRRVGIVLMTVPLAVAGIVPGLLLGDQPFGFMSLLGVMALAGVVVNNAIVLLEVVEARRTEGATVAQAVSDAVERRVRPILLTTATTVLGLLPLALSPSTLWPPMAWTMISGLVASTLLTLLVVPALYLLLFRPGRVLRWPWARAAARPAALVLLAVGVVAGVSSPADAQPAAPASSAPLLSAPHLPIPDSSAASFTSVSSTPVSAAREAAVRRPDEATTSRQRLTLADALALSARRPAADAARLRARAAGQEAVAEVRTGRLPRVEVGGEVLQRDRELELVTPLGAFPFGDRRTEAAWLTVVQPLFRPEEQLFAAPAARAEARSQRLAALRVEQEARRIAADAFLDVLAVDAARAANDSFLAALEARLVETAARVDAGRELESERLKVALARDDARQEGRALLARRRVALLELARAVGSAEPVEPVPWAETSIERAVAPPPPFSQALARALAARPDLAAAEEAHEAADWRRRAVRAERLPSLDATASYQWQGGSPYAEDAWAEGGLRLSWRPFAAGTRGARAAARAGEVAAREADLAELRRGIEQQLAAAYADLETARGALEVGESGVRQATETLRVERQRFAAGRLTTNDLLQAEAELRRQRTRRDLAALDLVRARVRAWSAIGEGPVPAEVMAEPTAESTTESTEKSTSQREAGVGE